MADGFTLTLDEDLTALLHRRAEEIGADPAEVARMTLQQGLFRYEDHEWIGDDPRTIAHDPADEADTRPWEEVREELKAYLAQKLAAKA